MVRFKIGNTKIYKDNDVWIIPFLMKNEKGNFVTTTYLSFYIKGNTITLPFKISNRDGSTTFSVREIEVYEPVKDYNIYECDYLYQIGDFRVPGYIIDKIIQIEDIQPPKFIDRRKLNQLCQQ
ncbi:MAG: hypothetical protein ACOCQD_03350 [archaeon]